MGRLRKKWWSGQGSNPAFLIILDHGAPREARDGCLALEYFLSKLRDFLPEFIAGSLLDAETIPACARIGPSMTTREWQDQHFQFEGVSYE